MEHIQLKNSSDSKLQNACLCYIRIQTEICDIFKKAKTIQSTWSDTQRFTHAFTIHLKMVSDQRLEVYDRMGNVLIKDVKPRRCEEIVTFAHCFPDPNW